jgi:hypothetical protein
VVFRAPADLADLLVPVLLLAAVRPVAPALRVPVVRLVPVFVARVEARGVAFRVEEDGFAAREVAARAAPAPVALPVLRDAAVAATFFAPPEPLRLPPLAVPRLATAWLFCLPVCLPVFVDFTPRGMSFAPLALVQLVSPCDETKTNQGEDAFPFARNRISRRPL